MSVVLIDSVASVTGPTRQGHGHKQWVVTWTCRIAVDGVVEVVEAGSEVYTAKAEADAMAEAMRSYIPHGLPATVPADLPQPVAEVSVLPETKADIPAAERDDRIALVWAGLGEAVRDNRAIKVAAKWVGLQGGSTRHLMGGSDVADILQIAAVWALKHADRWYPERGDLGRWFRGVVQLTARDYMRSRSRYRIRVGELEAVTCANGEPGGDDTIAELADTAPAPDVVAAQHDQLELVRDGMARLDDSERMVITLRDVQGLSTNETAERLGISSTAVKVRLLRARRALRYTLGLDERNPGGPDGCDGE